MPAPRELRALVPLEVVVVLAIAFVPFPETLPVALPLVIAATLSRWVRGRGWGELATGGLDAPSGSAARPPSGGLVDRALVGAAAGAIAIAVAAPLYGAFDVAAVDWWLAPAVRGDAGRLVIALAMVAAVSVAMELALRGWIVERMLELSPGPSLLPIVTGGLAEAILTPGFPAARIGAGLFGIGLGALYVAGGRNVLAPVAARVTFAIGAVVVEALSA